VIKKKFVINPFSAIIFNPPPIDDVKLQLWTSRSMPTRSATAKEKGPVLPGGTAGGKVRFIRLEYSGGDWTRILA